jgi:hypothetical protein
MTPEQKYQKEAEELYPYVTSENEEYSEEDIIRLHKRIGYITGRKVSAAEGEAQPQKGQWVSENFKPLFWASQQIPDEIKVHEVSGDWLEVSDFLKALYRDPEIKVVQVGTCQSYHWNGSDIGWKHGFLVYYTGTIGIAYDLRHQYDYDRRYPNRNKNQEYE